MTTVNGISAAEGSLNSGEYSSETFVAKISELMEGEMFGAGDLEVKDFMSGIELRLYENEYKITDGYVTVVSVTNSRVVLRFENLSFALKVSSNVFGEDYYPSNPKIHTINGTASFHNHLYKDGDWVPFF